MQPYLFIYFLYMKRYGDDFKGQTASLCVRRATYVDPETGKEDPAKKGVCSNFLCDAKPGRFFLIYILIIYMSI